MKEIFQFNNKVYTQKELFECLENLGISSGDMVCVHSSLLPFGKLLGDAKFTLDIIIQTFLTLIGKDGTLIIPTYSYSFTRGEIYDKKTSKCTVGVLGEHFRKMHGVYRTNEPIFSHAICGAKINLFKTTPPKECFGKNSAFEIMRDNEAKIILLGLNGDGFTYSIYIEQAANVSWRYMKNFKGTIINESGEKHEIQIDYFVRNLQINPRSDAGKRLKFLLDGNACRMDKFSGGNICVIDAKKSYDVLKQKLKENDKCYLKL